MSKQDIPVLLHNDKRGLLCIEDGQLDVLQLSADGRPPKRLLSCPTRLLLRARLAPPPTTATDGEAANRRLDLHALTQKSAKTSVLQLSKIHVLVQPTHAADAQEWVDEAMRAAYPVTNAFRRVLLIVNPFGGKGKGSSIVKQTVLPILEAAGCRVDLRETTHRYHAEEMVRSMELEYDVIASASGDGLIYEILNGLAARPDARKALRTPIAPIPTGSACACCTNLFGAKDTFNIPLATLNVIKGQHMTIDLCSVLLLPQNKRRVSFLSQALGLMVDVDIGTDHLRWMGDTRFMYGLLRGIAQNKNLKVRLRIDAVETDKEAMAAGARAAAREVLGTNVVGGGTDPLAMIRDVQRPSSIQSSGASGTSGSKRSNGTSGTNGTNGLDGADGAGASGTTNGDTSSSKASTGATERGENVTEPIDDDDGPLPGAEALQPDDSWFTIDTGTPQPPKPKFVTRTSSSLTLSRKSTPSMSRRTSGTTPSQHSASGSTSGMTNASAYMTAATTPVRATSTSDATSTSASALPTSGGWRDDYAVSYLYAGLMPWVSRDFNQWPVLGGADGLMDVVVQRVVPRLTYAEVMDGAEHGHMFWHESQHYYRARAFIAENLDKVNQPKLTIDGEGYDFDTFQVQVLPAAATLCALDGRFYLGQFLTKPRKGKN